jgi:hypothetical protein
MTTVTDTIYNGAGEPVSGTLFITANSQFEGASGEQVYEQPITVTIGSDGVFSVSLYPNDTATPAGTSYNVNYSLDGPPGFSGQAPEETWVVPTSVPAVGLADVRTSPTPIPSGISYLPLTGGTITGALAVNGATTLSSALTYGGITLTNNVTGTGKMVLDTSPTLFTPALGTPTALVGTNITGTAAGLKAGTVTTNANLTGGVTSVGNAATVVTNANLTGGVTSVGNAATVVTNANLTGGVTSVGLSLIHI